MFERKWRDVYDRLAVERKDKSLSEISGFDEKFSKDISLFRMKILMRLLSEFQCDERANVCEVGCGCGDKLSFFYQLGHHCFGVDYSENMIIRARQEMSRAKLSVADAAVLSFEDNSMDFIFSYSVYMYFESWDYCQKVLSEMYRIAKPNAVICIWDIPDIHEKEKVMASRGLHEAGYEHSYYDMNQFIQWFKAKEISDIKAEYNIIPEYKHSGYRFNLTVKLDKH